MSENENGPRAASEGTVAAVAFAALFLLFGLLTRIFDYADLNAAGAVEPSPLSPPFTLLFLLGDELIIALILGAALLAAWPRRPARIAVLLFATLYMAWLALEQVVFEFFFTHVDYVLFSETHDLENLSSSIGEALDPAFWTLLAFAFANGAVMLVGRFPAPIRSFAGAISRRRLVAAAGAAAYLAISFTLPALADQQGLDRSFPRAYVSSYLAAVEEEALIAEVSRRVALEEPTGREIGKAADAGVVGTSPRGARKLNVVWYLMESTSYRETSMFPDAPYDTTPFLDELAGKSLFFDNYYTIVAASTRSFFSALTGVYPYMDRNSDLSRYSAVELPTLPNILHEEGYATAFFANSDSMFEGLDSFVSNQAYDHYMDKNLVPDDALPADGKIYWGLDEEVMIDRALDWISSTREAGKPFYLSYNAVYPHHPFRVPKDHRDLKERDWGEPRERALFRASLAYADRSVKRMYEGLERMGLLETTLFIVTPDHGETFGDLHRKNYIHAEYCYEEDSRIFLILHNPDLFEEGREIGVLGSHLDILPTVLEALGIRRDLHIDGRSLFDEDRPRRPLFHFSRRQLAVRDGGYKFLMMRDRGTGKPELYDLEADPTEQENIASDNPDLVSKYKEMTLEWQARTTLAFKKRCAEAGMTVAEMAEAAEAKRKEMFAAAQIKLAGFTVCPGAGNTACGKMKTFPRGQPITVRATLAKPASAKIRVSVFHHKGDKVFGQGKEAEGRMEATFTVPTDELIPGERYRMRVSTVYYRAVHDSRWFPFYVK